MTPSKSVPAGFDATNDLARVRAALDCIRRTAVQCVNGNLAMVACAHIDQSWQKQACQMFFLGGAYSALTGRDRGCTADIAASCLSDDALDWLNQNCLNEFFFWSVVGQAAQSADSLPLSLEQIAHAGSLVAMQQSLTYARYAGGISDGTYSGDITPWHIRDWLERGILINSDRDHQPALAAGVLMVRLHKPYLMLGRWVSRQPMMELIFNPLFANMSEERPTGNHVE